MRRAKPFIFAAFIVATLMALMAAPAIEAEARELGEVTQGVTIDEALGCTQNVRAYLETHLDSYLGTPYKGFVGGDDPWSVASPQGDPVSPYPPGMNCVGFVWHALLKCGGNEGAVTNRNSNGVLQTGRWSNLVNVELWLRDDPLGKQVIRYRFDSIEALLASGRAKKGDIIICSPDYTDWALGHDSQGNTIDNHIGFFWGDSPSDNKFFHAFHPGVGVTAGFQSGVQISQITAKCYPPNQSFWLLPTEGLGKIQLQKVSAIPTNTDNSAMYSLEGAVYGVYSDEGCTQQAATLTTDAGGSAESPELVPGDYFVKELTAPRGYALDPNVYPVQVRSGETTTVNGGTVPETPQSYTIDLVLNKCDGELNAQGVSDAPQGRASLAGAEFTLRYYDGLFDDAAAAESAKVPLRIWVVRTDEAGHARLSENCLVSGDLYRNSRGEPCVPLGTVTIEETKAPEGYHLNDQKIALRFESGGNQETIAVYNAPTIEDTVIRGGVSVVKHDTETRERNPQGDATLGGTVFEIRSRNADHTVLVAGNEYGFGQTVCTITTDGTGAASTSADALPYGDYEIVETAPSSGYLLTDGEARPFEIREEGAIVSIDPEGAFYNNVIRGGVRVQKRDLESGLATPLGGASMAGAEFEITNRSAHEVIVNGQRKQPGEAVARIISGDDGVAASAPDLLPYGTYEIQEVVANTGYLLTDTAVRRFEIREEGKIVALPAESDWKNQVKRGDLEFRKVGESEMNRLAGVLFALTSQTTGERHLLVTDENGYANTAASWNPHTQRTNANDAWDAWVAGDPAAAEFASDDEAGIWFGLTTEGALTPTQDELGALPFDTYTLEELPCAANEGYELQTITDIHITRHNVCVDLGTIDDPLGAQPRIATSAADGADGDRSLVVDPEAVIVDAVAYEGLTPGRSYHLVGTLMDSQTGEPFAVDDEPVVQTLEFTPQDSRGSVQMEFRFDASALSDNARLTVFEELYVDEKLVAEHADLTSSEQTVTFQRPMLATTATDAVDGDHELITSPVASLVDNVAYRNLVPGNVYRIVGELHDKGSGEAVTVGGEPVTAEVEFVPETPDGTQPVTFAFDASALRDGFDLVVFEHLYRLDAELAQHADTEDEGQTLHVVTPQLTSFAQDGLDGDKTLLADGKANIVDQVYLDNLIPGETYRLRSLIIDPQTAQDAQPAAVLFNGKTAEDNFTSGQAMRASDFLADYWDFAGIPLSDYENADTKMWFDLPAEQVDDDEMAALGKTFSDIAPMIAQDSQEFTATAPSMTLQSSYENLDARGLGGKTLRCFQMLEQQGSIVATEVAADYADEEVQVVAPSLRTEATDGADGDHDAAASADGQIVDRVGYENLIVGQTYEINGILMDKASGEPLTVDGQRVTAGAAFEPTASDGEISLEFPLDTSSLGGREAVVFEFLSRDGLEIATHADLNDEAQTVKIIAPPEEPAPTVWAKTIDALRNSWMILLGVAVAAVLALGGGLYLRKRAHGGSMSMQSSRDRGGRRSRESEDRFRW